MVLLLGAIAIRAVGLDWALLPVDDRGRVEEDAIFGKPGAFLRVEFKAPDARFLTHQHVRVQTLKQSIQFVIDSPLLYDISLQRKRTRDSMQFLGVMI